MTLSQRDYQPALVDQTVDRPPPTGRRCASSDGPPAFGRVELVTTTAAPAVDRPVCAVPGRQLRAPTETSRQVPSDAWRCGKVDGYPPFQVALRFGAARGCDNRKPCAR